MFSPNELTKLKQLYHDASVKVESSDIRIFSDDDYKNMGITVADTVSDCDVLFGVKEVPVENLIPNKAYFFFLIQLKNSLIIENCFKRFWRKILIYMITKRL